MKVLVANTFDVNFDVQCTIHQILVSNKIPKYLKTTSPVSLLFVKIFLLVYLFNQSLYLKLNNDFWILFTTYYKTFTITFLVLRCMTILFRLPFALMPLSTFQPFPVTEINRNEVVIHICLRS